MTIRDIELAQQERDRRFEKRRVIVPGVIRSIDGSTEASPNYTWVSERNRPESAIPALNKTALSIAETPVLLARNPQQGKPYEYEIIDINMENILETETTRASRLQTAPHAENHQYPTESTVGADPVLIYQPALQMLKTISSSGLLVNVNYAIYNNDGVGREFPGQSIDLTSSIPGVGLVRKTLLYLSVSTNTILTVDGTAVIDNGAIPIPSPKSPNPRTDRLSSYVTLRNGQTTISQTNDIVDIRDFIGRGGDVSEYEASEVGQVLYSTDGTNFTPQLPMVTASGFILINSDGKIMVT